MTASEKLAALVALIGTGVLSEWLETEFLPAMQGVVPDFTPRQVAQIDRFYAEYVTGA